MIKVDCIFDGLSCRICGWTMPVELKDLRRNCEGPPCEYLGDEIQTDGVAVKVKCNCKASGGYRDEFHTVYECHAPQHHRNGKPGRCLPNMRNQFDDDHQIEASIYNLCRFCEIRNEPCHA